MHSGASLPDNLTELLAHIGIPFLAVVAILIFRAPTRPALAWRQNCNEIALEFAILGIGATGGVFLNRRIVGGNSGVYGILVVVLEMVFAALIVNRGSHIERIAPNAAPAARWDLTKADFLDTLQGLLDFFLGFLPIMVTGAIVLFPG